MRRGKFFQHLAKRKYDKPNCLRKCKLQIIFKDFPDKVVLLRYIFDNLLDIYIFFVKNITG